MTAFRHPKRIRSDWSHTVLDRGCVMPDDVAYLRRTEFPIGLPTRQNAETLFLVERNVGQTCAGWSELFAELLIDFVVWGDRPTGVISQAQAEWVLAEFDRGPTDAGLALLVGLIHEAVSIPSWFAGAVRRRASRARSVVAQSDLIAA